MAITPTWDYVYINVYSYNGANPNFPLFSPQTNIYSRGTVAYIGPNVNRVSVGQLVVFKIGGFVQDQTNSWAVVPQDAVLTIFTSDVAP